MLASAGGAGRAFNFDFIRPDQENILAIAIFENTVHVTKGTFPLLSQRGADRPILHVARPTVGLKLFCVNPNQCLPLSSYVRTSQRKIHTMKALFI